MTILHDQRRSVSAPEVRNRLWSNRAGGCGSTPVRNVITKKNIEI
jgi:hypothetical protein